ncbi:MAG: twin-arginine translocation signal domain-containing protein, partial [Bacteroidales bacterium]
MTINRRKFLKDSMLTTAGIGIAGSAFSAGLSKSVSANDKINIALIGCRSKGFGILKNSLEYDDVN